MIGQKRADKDDERGACPLVVPSKDPGPKAIPVDSVLETFGLHF